MYMMQQNQPSYNLWENQWMTTTKDHLSEPIKIRWKVDQNWRVALYLQHKYTALLLNSKWQALLL